MVNPIVFKKFVAPKSISFEEKNPITPKIKTLGLKLDQGFLCFVKHYKS